MIPYLWMGPVYTIELEDRLVIVAQFRGHLFWVGLDNVCLLVVEYLIPECTYIPIYYSSFLHNTFSGHLYLFLLELFTFFNLCQNLQSLLQIVSLDIIFRRLF